MAEQHKHHVSDSGLRTFVSELFAFLIAMLLTAASLLVVLRFGIFNEKSVVGQLDEEYYGYVRESIEEDALDFTLPTGVQPAVLEGLFDTDRVGRDAKGFISSAYQGKEYTVDTSELENEIQNRVTALFTESNMEITAETEEQIRQYAADVAEIYRKGIELPGMSYIKRAKDYFMPIFMIGIGITLILALVLAILCIRLYKWPHRGMRSIAHAFGGAAVMCFAAPFALYTSGFYKGVHISLQSFYHFVITQVTRHLYACFMMAGFWLALMLITILAIAAMRRSLTR